MKELDRTTEPQVEPCKRPSAASAAEAWLADHGDFLFAFAVARVRRQDVAEDLVQETLLAAMASYERFEGRSSTRTWLTSILRHKLADHLRQRDLTSSDAGSGPMENSFDEGALERFVVSQFTKRGKWKSRLRDWSRQKSPPDHLESEEFRQVLLDCIDKLPARPAEAINLVERGEMTLEQISNVLGVTATHVGVILYRARLALRECLEKNWFRTP